jgi:hypothetical protein
MTLSSTLKFIALGNLRFYNVFISIWRDQVVPTEKREPVSDSEDAGWVCDLEFSTDFNPLKTTLV